VIKEVIGGEMAPLLGDWEDNKLRETSLEWQPVGVFKQLYYYFRYGGRYKFTTRYYNEYWFNMHDHIDLIDDMKKQGLNFQIREAADKSFERKFVKFIAGGETDLTAMRIMK
jgi:hypothetical protein